MGWPFPSQAALTKKSLLREGSVTDSTLGPPQLKLAFDTAPLGAATCQSLLSTDALPSGSATGCLRSAVPALQMAR